MKERNEAKVTEAVKRLHKMGILEEAIQNFKKSGKVYVSMTPYGILYDLTEQQKTVLQQFEEKRNALVYLVVNKEDEREEMDAYIFVTDNPGEWEIENDDLEAGEAIAYVHNLKKERLSEVGYIGWKRSPFGGIIRMY